MTPATNALAPGFADPVFDSQSAFRTIMSAVAYPARVGRFARPAAAPAGLSPAAATIALTLCDLDTPVWLDAAAATPAALAHLRFHSGAPVVEDAGGARFCFIGDVERTPPLHAFHAGEDKYPDRSATLVIEVQSFARGAPRLWRGPGIKGELTARIAGPGETFWEQWALNHALYPLGVDVIFTCGDEVAGLPRGVAVET